MSNPAGNSAWAWEWMGFDPPFLADNDEPQPEKYKKFRSCYDFYYGIGVFDYWKRIELDKLSDDDKLELLGYLMEDNQKKIKARKYLGLNEDGTLNTDINPYANSRTKFFGVLTLKECRQRKYPHNQRCRYKNGFHCDDCDNFFGDDTEEYLRTQQMGDYSIDIWNIGVYFHRAKIKKPQSYKQLKVDFDALRKHNCYDITIDEIHDMANRINDFKIKHKQTIQKGKDKYG